MTDGHLLFDTPPEAAFDRLTRLASVLLGAPVTLLSLVDTRRQFFKSITGLTGWAAEARGTPLSHSFCQHVVASGAPLEVEDARIHPLVKDNLAIGDLGVIAYLGVPVHARDGRPLGSFCAIDGQPRQWTARDREVLAVLAGAVDAEVALRETLVRQAALIEDLSATNAALETARAEAEAARQVAESALDDRTRLFAALGHELRTPLNGIFGGLALLETATEPAQRARFSAMIRDSGQTLLRFVDNVVAYAGASAGRIVAQSRPFDPADPVAGAVRTCAGYAASRGLTLTQAGGAGALEPCHSDPDLVQQVLTNLVGNSIKYTETGSVTVYVAQDETMTTWRVADTGPGVPEHLRDKIFLPFERGETQQGGSGLGLAVAQLTAEALGGIVRLEPSGPGEGAVFTLSVPTNDRAETMPPTA